MNSYHKTILS